MGGKSGGTSGGKLFKVVFVAMMLALLANTMQPLLALAAPTKTASVSTTANTSTATTDTSSTTTATPTNVCNLYPIALHTSSIAGLQPGDPIGDIYNGSSPGNFGWLSWTGDPSEPTLVTSLTPPGDSSTYVNPSKSTDHVLVPGDWVYGKPGVSNSTAVANALNQLLNIAITVPVWDQTQGHGSKSEYHVVGFAEVVITTYQLPGDNRISARYEGSTDCQAAPPPPPPPPPLPPLDGATLTLSPGVAGPDVTGAMQTFTATLKNRVGSPLSGYTVTLKVTGANLATSGGMTNTNGQTTLTYIGGNSGSDTAQASTTDGSTTVQSNTATVTWVTPVQAVSTTTIWARVFASDSSGVFKATPDIAPLFSMPVPTINFNPPSGTVPGNTSGVTEYSRPMADVTTDLNGNYTGTIVLQGNGYQAGAKTAAGDESFFNAVFTGSFTVAAAGNATFNMFTDDGFIMGVGNGATRVSGPLVGTYQATTAFASLPTVGAYNIATAPTGNTITVNFPAAGSYPFELDYSEGICCQLVVQATMVTATGTQGIPPTGSLTLTPNTVASQPAGGTQTFTVAAADAGGNPLANVPVQLTITGANAQALRATTDSTGKATFTYTGSYAGTDTVQAIAWVSNLASYSAQVNLTWTNPPIQPPATPQTQSPGWIGSPAPQSTVTGLVPITLGSNVTLSTGTVAYWPASNPQAVTTLASGVTGIGGTTLATLDTTALPNGTYVVQLLGTDNTGNQLNSETLVTVAGENKPGRVTFSVTDLTVPVAGIPITIGRTYDSLNKGQSGDFGYGWSLSVSTKLTVDPATHDVTLTLPTGRRTTFAFTPQSTGGVFGYLLTPGYTPEPGVYGSLTSNGCSLLAVSGGQYFCFPGGQYAPTTYTYTDPYGRVYVMGADGSLQSITDLNGNVLTFTASGIRSSAGNAAVTFTRDSATGRITAITDPAGNVYTYGYDPQGNLASVSFPGVATPATYTYDSTHLLLTAKDPGGNIGATTTYDANGRLASVTDALGNKTTYSYDLNTNTTTITNPDGGVVVDTYDSFGNLLSATDPLGHTTTNTYDGNHNLLTQTDALGHKTTYTYDSQGHRTSATDPLGHASGAAYNEFNAPVSITDAQNNQRTLAYDSNSRLTSVTDSLGTEGAFTWDSQGDQLTRTDGNGKVTTFAYDGYGNLLSQTDPLGDKTSYTYDTLGHRLTSTAANGKTTSYTYDALGHVLTETDPLGHVTTYQYDADGNQTAVIDPLGRKTTYSYDAANHLTQTTYPDGTTTKDTYDFRGDVLTHTDQAGHVTQDTYDLAGQKISETTAAGTPDAATTQYAYDAAGHLVKITRPTGASTSYTYDAAGYVTSTTDPLGHTTTQTHNAAGQETSQTDANGHTASYTYDARGRLVQTTYPDGTVAKEALDGAGNELSSTDQAGKVTTYTHDDAGRLLSVADPLADKTSYAYDASGNRTSITDANGHTTTFVYDALNREVKKALPDGSYEAFAYDAAGNETSHRLTDGNTNTAIYDVLGQLTKLTYFDGTSVSYTYTPAGLPQTVVDGRGTTSYVYDNQDRVTQVTQPNGQSVTYSYDADGNRQGMTTPAGTTTYSYDAANRLASVTAPSAGKVTFAYDNVGNPTQRVLPNGITISYSYDTLNRLTNVTEQQGSTSVASYAYTLDPVGNRTRVTEADGTTAAWSYDGAYRLTGETLSAPGGAVESQASYTYDGAGNRLTMLSGGVTTNYGFNTLDQLTSATTGSQSTTYNYDGRGNLTTVSTTGGSSGGSPTTSYRWDAANDLTGVTLPNGTTTSYSYDADGRQVSQTTAAGTTNYLWDTQSGNGDIVVETDANSGAVQASYLLGNGEVLAQTRSGTSSYVLTDGQNSVRALTNGSGSVTDQYRYDAFGNVQSSQGTTTNPYGYDGQRLDPQTGLYQLRARSYDPTTGRFLSRDPAATDIANPAQLDRYTYAQNNPVNYADPSGRTSIAIPGGAVPGTAESPAGAGGTLGEYASLLFFAVLRIAAVATIGAEVACKFMYDASLVMALLWDGAGLLALDAIDPGEPPLCHIPVFKYTQATPTIWQHIVDAQAGRGSRPGRKFMLLYYIGVGNRVLVNGRLKRLKQVNRDAACAGFVPQAPPNTSCDEYPFATTFQGGSSASVRAVPPAEQSTQGTLLQKFYHDNHVDIGGYGPFPGEFNPFAVVPVDI